jgi:hypothetical protein
MLSLNFLLISFHRPASHNIASSKCWFFAFSLAFTVLQLLKITRHIQTRLNSHPLRLGVKCNWCTDWSNPVLTFFNNFSCPAHYHKPQQSVLHKPEMRMLQTMLFLAELPTVLKRYGNYRLAKPFLTDTPLTCLLLTSQSVRKEDFSWVFCERFQFCRLKKDLYFHRKPYLIARFSFFQTRWLGWSISVLSLFYLYKSWTTEWK